MDPRITLTLREPDRIYSPGDLLACQCQIDADESTELLAMEASVLWYSEGKGDEDMSVHYFLRRVAADAENGDLRISYEFRTQLPNSPLSYSGVIVKIRWCVRLRVFLRRGRELCAELPFVIGNVPTASAAVSPQSMSARDQRDAQNNEDNNLERSQGIF
jgi:hypothetical protein